MKMPTAGIIGFIRNCPSYWWISFQGAVQWKDGSA